MSCFVCPSLFLLTPFAPHYMSGHVLYVFRSACLVTYVTCPFSRGRIIVHVISDACRVFSGIRVFTISVLFSCVDGHVVEFAR